MRTTGRRKIIGGKPIKTENESENCIAIGRDTRESKEGDGDDDVPVWRPLYSSLAWHVSETRLRRAERPMH